MKNLFCTVLLAVSILLSSCGGGISSSLPTMGKVDIQMLSNDVELKKVYDVMKEMLGSNIQKVHEIQLTVSSPSIEKGREGKPNELNITMFYLYPKDKTKLYRVTYDSEFKWNESIYSVELRRGTDAESFVLEEEMYDLSFFTAEKLCQIVQDALAKYKDDKKYSVQYVKEILIEYGTVEVTVYGKLASNGIEQKQRHKTDFDGEPLNR